MESIGAGSLMAILALLIAADFAAFFYFSSGRIIDKKVTHRIPRQSLARGSIETDPSDNFIFTLEAVTPILGLAAFLFSVSMEVIA